MMISPQTFCWLELQGKSAEEIMTKIRQIKKKISRLKLIMEHPHYISMIHPSEEVQLACHREYLAQAKKAYAEAGGVYSPTQAELRAEAFDLSIPNISKIKFTIGGFFGGFETKTFTFGEREVYVYTEHSLHLEPFPPPDYPGEKPRNKKTFLRKLQEIHIGEWRTNYDTKRFGIVVCDGTSWELTIEFSDGHKTVKCGGCNAYPYNFKKLAKLFDIKLRG